MTHKRRRRGGTPRRDLYVELRQEGMTTTEIAAECGVSLQAVTSALALARADGASIRYDISRFRGDRHARVHITRDTRTALDARAVKAGMSVHELADRILARILSNDRLVGAIINPEEPS
jgi:predicted transcriptional regulator